MVPAVLEPAFQDPAARSKLVVPLALAITGILSL